jgi:hypothetical protein
MGIENTDNALLPREENSLLQRDESPLWCDSLSDSVLSLLEENARLRRLAKLSNLLPSNVTGRT